LSIKRFFQQNFQINYQKEFAVYNLKLMEIFVVFVDCQKVLGLKHNDEVMNWKMKEDDDVNDVQKLELKK